MEHPVDARASRRVLILGRIALGWAALIVLRLLYLQVVAHDDFKRIADSQHRHSFDIVADRGEIVDRTGHPLALSIRTTSVVINPQRVGNAAFFAGNVAPILGLDTATLQNEIEDRQSRSGKRQAGRGYMMLKRHISADEQERLRALPFRFFEYIRDSRREYPNRATGSHVVGSVDKYNAGNSGVEQKLNGELEGKSGKLRALTDSLLGRYYSWVEKQSEPGVNLQLTVQHVIQHDVEKFLAEGVAASGAQHGSVVVMDPRNGEVLALANYPTFDPTVEIPDNPRAKAAMMENRRNIAVSAPCEPGSVMKMITVAMALDSGKYTPDTPIFCENGSFPRPKRRPIRDVHGYGSLPVGGVLIKSSNIGVAKISLNLGPRMLWDYLKKFGMGDKTGIELPGESRGMLRNQECKGPGDRWCWTPISHEYIAFGHEIGATAVQLARATSVIANGGLLIDPHIVMRKERRRDNTVVETLPVEFEQPRRVLRAETAFTVRRIMQQVVLEGTGKRAKIPGYTSGGKTGSAEVFENGAWNRSKHNSSFIGFAPVTNPRVVVVVTLNGTPKQGGTVAAPLFSKVALSALRILQVPKDQPETDIPQEKLLAEVMEKHLGPPPKALDIPAPKPAPQEPAAVEPKEPAFDGVLAGLKVPDFTGKPVVAVLRESAAIGLPVEIVGHGRAKGQSPPPGTVLPLGGRVQVEFARQ